MKGVLNVAIDMVGRRFGSLSVLAFVGRSRLPSGQSRRIWLCRCDCGSFTHVVGSQLRRGRVQRCRKCGYKHGGEARSVRLSTGESLVELHRRTGISLNTLQQRLFRGWPHERLGEPVKPGLGQRIVRGVEHV